MALLKKTVVLTNNGAEGYITVVRVGDEVGAKIVGSSFEKGMFAAIKIGSEPVFYAKLDGERTEVNMSVSFNQNDDISCLILKGDILIAKAGRSLSKRELAEYFISRETQNTPNEITIEPTPMVVEPIQIEVEVVEDNIKDAVVPNYPDEEVIQKRPQNIKKATKPKESKAEAVKVTANLEPDVVAPTVEPKIEENFAGNVESIDNDAEKEFLSRLHSTGSKNFYQNVKERLDDLFVIHPRENELEKIIPESKWVKIRYDGDDYYVVGSLTDDGSVAYLAYGVPGIAEVPPPKLASDISDWLPVPNMPPPYKGYWLIFQNAEDGKVGNIK
jgi:hypothetical protein